MYTFSNIYRNLHSKVAYTIHVLLYSVLSKGKKSTIIHMSCKMMLTALGVRNVLLSVETSTFQISLQVTMRNYTAQHASTTH